MLDVPLSHHFASIAVAVEVILLKMEPSRAKQIFEETMKTGGMRYVTYHMYEYHIFRRCHIKWYGPNDIDLTLWCL